MKRIVLTGYGAVSPLGRSVDEIWPALLAGESGIGMWPVPEPERFRARICGLVKDYDPTDYFSMKEIRKMDPSIQYALIAANEAVDAAGLDASMLDPQRIGVMVGSGCGGLASIEQGYETYLDQGPRRISANFIPSLIINMIAGYISIKHGFRGPNLSIVTACSTGTHNIGVGSRLIASGDADVMLVGGAEAASTILSMAGFGNMRALSCRNDEPTKASRPWDKDRDGFVLSNGGAVLVLESLEHALARGANIICEVAGVGMNSDAFHATQPDLSGSGARRVMKMALQDAGLKPSDVDYINAHGTSTSYNDKIEAEAIEHVFAGYLDDLAVSSTKSMLGHMLGAAGAIEAIICAKTIETGDIPPTINCDDPDVGLSLNLVRHKAQKKQVNVAMSNSFGFGGTNGSLVFLSYDE